MAFYSATMPSAGDSEAPLHHSLLYIQIILKVEHPSLRLVQVP